MKTTKLIIPLLLWGFFIIPEMCLGIEVYNAPSSGGSGGSGDASYPINLAGGTATTGILPIVQGGSGTNTANGAASAFGVGAEDSPTFTGVTATTGSITSNVTTTGTITNAYVGTLTIQGSVIGLKDADIPPDITLTNLTQISTRLYDDLSGTSTIKPTQIAVGTTTLSGAVNVSGTVTATAFAGDGSQLTGISAGSGEVGSWTSDGGKLYPKAISDKIGIGTTTPATILYVVGTSTIDGNMTIGTTTTGSMLAVGGTCTAMAFSGNYYGNGSKLTGISSTPTTPNFSFSEIGVSGLIFNTANVLQGNLLTTLQNVSVATVTSGYVWHITQLNVGVIASTGGNAGIGIGTTTTHTVYGGADNNPPDIWVDGTAGTKSIYLGSNSVDSQQYLLNYVEYKTSGTSNLVFSKADSNQIFTRVNIPTILGTVSSGHIWNIKYLGASAPNGNPGFDLHVGVGTTSTVKINSGAGGGEHKTTNMWIDATGGTKTVYGLCASDDAEVLMSYIDYTTTP